MARFDMQGLDPILAEMKRLGELVGDTADKMLLAGAEAVKEEWRKSAERHQIRDTGDMIESIGYPRGPETAGDIRTIDIYPQGKNRRGVRNAEVAFIQNYGTSKTPATHWIDEADEASAEPVQNAFERIWDEFISEREG